MATYTITHGGTVGNKRRVWGTYTLTTGGVCAITTGLRPIEFASVCAKDSTTAHTVSSSNYSKGSFKAYGTSTTTGVWEAIGIA